MVRYRFDEIIERLKSRAEVELLTEGDLGGTTVSDRDVHRPGMGLMGYTTGFLPERVQVFGESEIGYLRSLDAKTRREAVARILDLQIPGAFISRGLEAPTPLLEESEKRGIPVARVSISTAELTEFLSDILDELFAPRVSLHGTLVDVYGVGVLLTGRSGIGKSETALDLVERGHRLVADDLVEIVCRGGDVLLGRGRESLKHHMEIRGVGIVDVLPIFGVRSIRMQKRIEVEVRLEEWEQGKTYERVGLDREASEILDVRIPRVVVPIVPGKNITVIAEVIALDFMLRTYGIDSADALNRSLIDSMTASGRVAQYLQHDIE